VKEPPTTVSADESNVDKDAEEPEKDKDGEAPSSEDDVPDKDSDDQETSVLEEEKTDGKEDTDIAPETTAEVD